MLSSQSTSISPDVVTSLDLVTVQDVVYGEQYIVSMAHVIHAKVDAGLVGG
jgi:hypothetical protein